MRSGHRAATIAAVLCACVGDARFIDTIVEPGALEIARDWLDYVAALGVLVSLVLAAAALIYARKSARAAQGSADAAETTATAATQEAEQTRELVRIAEDQHERLVEEANRRPVLATPTLSFETMCHPGELTMAQIFSVNYQVRLGETPRLWLVVVRAAFQNVGDKLAEHVLARFIVPQEVGLWRSGPRGEHPTDVELDGDVLTLEARGTQTSAHAHGWRIPRLPPDESPEGLHAVLVFGQPGEYEVELQADHEEAQAVSQRFRVTVPVQGSAEVTTT